MASPTSSSLSGSSSPPPSTIVVRSISPAPRPPQARTSHSHTSRLTSEDEHKGRLGPDESAPLAPCRSPRNTHVSTAGLFPIGTDRKSHSSRPKVRSIYSSNDSGSPISVSPSHRVTTSKFSPHAGFQAHQSHHEFSAAEFTNRRLLNRPQIQVPRLSSVSSALSPLPLASLLPPATPPPRFPSKQRRSLSQHCSSSLESPQVLFPASGPPTPSPCTRPLSTRYVLISVPIIACLWPVAASRVD
jgi:hypothetical protein